MPAQDSQGLFRMEGHHIREMLRGRKKVEIKKQQLAAARAGLGQNQFALSNFQRQNVAGDVANLGQLGAFRQGLEQSRLQADIDAARTGAYEPFRRLQQYGTGLGGLAGFAQAAPLPTATPSPFSTALSTALGIGGLFGKFR